MKTQIKCIAGLIKSKVINMNNTDKTNKDQLIKPS